MIFTLKWFKPEYDLLIAIIDDLPYIIMVIVNSLPEIIDAIVQGLIGAWPQLIRAGIDLFLALITNLPQIIGSIVVAIGKILKAIIKGFVDGMSAMSEIGGQLISGLWNGISNKISWIIGKIKGFGSSVISAIKGIFDINSPSKETEYVGDMLGEGVGVGIEKSLSKVKRQTAKLHDAVVGELSFKNEQIKVNQAIEYAKVDQDGKVIDYEKLAKWVWALAPEFNRDVVMDKKKVGEVIEPEVSKIQASKAKDRKIG